MAAVYDVTYYKNDGSGTSLNCGDPVPAPLDQITSVGYNWDQESPTPQGYDWSRDGYTFVEWNTSADGTGTSYAPGATNYQRTLSIYAIWQENVNDITVTYNGNTIFSTSASGTQIFETENSFMADDLVLTYNRYSPETMVLPWSADSTSSGTQRATISMSTSTRYLNIPVGYNDTARYYTIGAVPEGTAGTPTATKGTVSNHSISVTPKVTNVTGYIVGGTKTGTAVTVSASELVSGTKSITSSGTTDVTNYANASVAAGSATPPSTISGSSATVSTGTNTLTLSKTISVTPTVSAGYIASGTAGNSSVSLTASVTTKGATTYTPTTTDQTIASGTYLTGVQTVKGDSNLVAANIANGVTIFGITGSHQGGTDVSDTTATDSDVLTGKYFYTAAGVKTQGTITVYAGTHHLAGYSVTISLTNPSSSYAFESCKIFQLNSTHLDEYNYYDDFTQIGIIDSPTGSTTVTISENAIALAIGFATSGMSVWIDTSHSSSTGNIEFLSFSGTQPYFEVGESNCTLYYSVSGISTITFDSIEWDDD